jgi:hypothetical protein
MIPSEVLSYNDVVNTKTRVRLHLLLWIFLLSAALSSCSSGPSKSIALASFEENDVDVSIQLTQQSDGRYFLNATFTPPKGYHLYGKDIPANGVDGLGRPTLLELTPNSSMKAIGPLTANTDPQTPNFEPRELLVYPQGAVTLGLPVKLPAGDEWVKDEFSVTYMACNAGQCKPPVEAKIVQVRVPGADVIDSK